MILKARMDETLVHYANSQWTWYEEDKLLYQRILPASVYHMSIPWYAGEETKTLARAPRPTLQLGQRIYLDEKSFYVVNIETSPKGRLYVYSLSEERIEPPASFWFCHVEERHEATPGGTN
jgi:hypothetical protein